MLLKVEDTRSMSSDYKELIGKLASPEQVFLTLQCQRTHYCVNKWLCFSITEIEMCFWKGAVRDLLVISLQWVSSVNGSKELRVFLSCCSFLLLVAGSFPNELHQIHQIHLRN